MKRKRAGNSGYGGSEADLDNPSLELLQTVSISTKAKSCDSCRRLKIKCSLPLGPDSVCEQCEQRGIVCTSSQSLQNFLHQQTIWKNGVDAELRQLRQSVFTLQNEGQTTPRSLQNASSMERDVGIEEQQIERAQVNSAQSLTLIPGRSLYEITKLPSFADTFQDVPDVETRTREDVIAKGLVSLNDAEALYVKFKGLDQYVYSITLMHDSLSHVRQSSRLLTASICSVASLHNPNHDQTHLVCKQEFINLASSKAFSRHRSLDDIRALAIGAFWLHDVCVVLCAHAVQFASDLQVEHSLEQLLDPKVPEAKKVELYLRVRLWYLLYVCDHQFSIPHGRAPLVRENLAVREWERFLQSPLTIEADQRLVSQVHLWSIMARAYDRFGPNVYAPITNENFKHIRSFIVELDLLRIHWAVKFSVNEFIGNYPANGLILHHYFAKLHLCILAFRRRSESAQPLGLDIGPESAEFGSEAITCARGIIQIIVQDEELHGMLVGMPLYFDTMITFAAIFLLSVALFSQGRFEISEASTFGVVGQLVTILQRQSAYASRHHILSRIAPGLLSFLRGCENRAGSHYSPLIPASGQGEQVDGRYFFPTSYGDLLGQLGTQSRLAGNATNKDSSFPDFLETDFNTLLDSISRF